MTTTLPTVLPTTTLLENDKDDTSLRTGNMADFQNNAADTLIELSAMVGIQGSAATTSLDYKLKNAASNNPGHTHSGSALTGIPEANITADGSIYVRKSTTQTITGEKTFSTLPILGTLTGIVSGATGVLTALANGTRGQHIFMSGASPVLAWLSPVIVDLAERYGVSTSNTAAQNTTAIELAMTDASATGTVLLFPGGTIPVNNLAAVTKGICFQGLGIGSTILSIAQTTGDFLTVSSFNVSIRDMEITSSVTRTSGAHVKLTTNLSASFEMTNVFLRNWFIGIDNAGSNSAMVSHVTIHTPSTAAGAIGVRLNNAAVLATVFHGMVVNGGGGTNVTGFQISACGDVEIIGSTVISCLYALDMSPASGSVTAVKVATCNLDASTVASSIGVRIAPSGTGSVGRCSFDGVEILGFATGSHGFHITNTGTGIIDDITIRGPEILTMGGSGINLAAGAKHVWVDGGVISACTGNGVSVAADVTEFAIRGMRIGPMSVFYAGNANGIIIAAGASDFYTVTDNDLRGNTTAAFTDGGTGVNKRTWPNTGATTGTFQAVSANTLSFDETNVRLGLGTLAAVPAYGVDYRLSLNATLPGYRVWNPNTGTAARAEIAINADAPGLLAIAYSAAYTGTTLGQNRAGSTFVGMVAGAGSLLIGTSGVAGGVYLGNNDVTALSITGSQVVTFVNAPVMTALTASQYVKTSAGKALASVATIPNTDVTGLGTMSTQAASAVAITGGTVTGITDLVVADGGTGASTLTGVLIGNGASPFTAVGAWTAVTTASTLAATTDSGTWTIDDGDLAPVSYMILGKTMFLNFNVFTSSLSATPLSLTFTIPGGNTAAKRHDAYVRILDNAVEVVGRAKTFAAGTTIQIDKVSGAVFALQTNTLYILFSLVFEIQ